MEHIKIRYITMKNSISFVSVILKNIAVVAGAFICGFNFTTFFHEPTSLVGGLWAVISAIIVIEATKLIIGTPLNIQGTAF